jgi:HEAT repeat protein
VDPAADQPWPTSAVPSADPLAPLGPDLTPMPTLRVPLALLLVLAACGGPSTADAVAGNVAADEPAVTLARLAREPEGKGRQPLFRALRAGPAAQVLPALRTGLGDPDPAMRAAAAMAAGRRQDGAQLVPDLLTLATSDAEGPVRIAATRSLAQLRAVEAFEPLRANLGHAVPETRLSALRALARIDAGRAAGLPELARLQLDPDARISGAATKISRGVSPM